jgi:hypothetical protein
MHISDWLVTNGMDQGDLARIIKRGSRVEPRDRVRAHRIFHGAIPNEKEMPKIFQATGGEVPPNSFYNLPNQISVGEKLKPKPNGTHK